MARENERARTIPSSSREFGAGLRSLRTVGLRRLASQQAAGPERLVLSKSQLSRYEAGEQLPSLRYAQHLDDLYDAAGWVTMSLRTLWRPKWNPWAEEHGDPGRLHVGDWPAPYRGIVWIKVKPTPDNLGKRHRLTLDWGPWRQVVRCALVADGVVLMTGKAPDADGISKACNLSADRPVFTLYGAGDALAGEKVLDIRSGWSQR